MQTEVSFICCIYHKLASVFIICRTFLILLHITAETLDSGGAVLKAATLAAVLMLLAADRCLSETQTVFCNKPGRFTCMQIFLSANIFCLVSHETQRQQIIFSVYLFLQAVVTEFHKGQRHSGQRSTHFNVTQRRSIATHHAHNDRGGGAKTVFLQQQ